MTLFCKIQNNILFVWWGTLFGKRVERKEVLPRESEDLLQTTKPVTDRWVAIGNNGKELTRQKVHVLQMVLISGCCEDTLLPVSSRSEQGLAGLLKGSAPAILTTTATCFRNVLSSRWPVLTLWSVAAKFFHKNNVNISNLGFAEKWHLVSAQVSLC